MAASDLSTLYVELPKLFEEYDPPSRWDDYHIVPVEFNVDDPYELDSLEEAFAVDKDAEQIYTDLFGPLDESDLGSAFAYEGNMSIPGVEDSFPGGPRSPKPNAYPPPDSLAFYLPFHYYYPELWGVYLIAEGVNWLATALRRHSGWDRKRKTWNLTHRKAVASARTFLYYHEAFHHKTESFATRLEVTHRQALYRLGFQKLFDDTFLTDDCLEEALANAHAYRKVEEALKARKWKKRAVLKGLRAYIKGQEPGYNRALEFIEEDVFRSARNQFSELNHDESLPHEGKDSKIWKLFGHGYRGIARINSYANYLVKRDSPLLDRVDLHGRRISYRKLKKELDSLVGLNFERQGKGSHEVYRTDEGDRVTLYYTDGDVPRGTLNSILKQAGVDMNVHDFIRAQS